MIVRRFLAGLLLFGLAIPALGAAPRERNPKFIDAPPFALTGTGSRALARADGFGDAAADPSPSPPSPSPAPSAGPVTPASSPSPEMLSKARAEFTAWQNGSIDLTRYIPEARTIFTPAFVTDLATKYLKPLGALTAFTQVQKTTDQGAELYVYRATGEKGAINMLISWNVAGLVQFIRFVPAT